MVTCLSCAFRDILVAGNAARVLNRLYSSLAAALRAPAPRRLLQRRVGPLLRGQLTADLPVNNTYFFVPNFSKFLFVILGD